MENECTDCGALKWKNEDLNCCGNGKYKLPLFPDPPKFIKRLLTETNERSKFFRRYPRAINSMFAMATMGVQNQQVKFKNNFPLFKIHGMVHHRIGHLKSSHKSAHFAQIYMFDPDEQLSIRTDNIVLYSEPNKISQIVKDRDQQHCSKIFRKYYTWLAKYNIFVQQFSHIREIIRQQKLCPTDLPNLTLRLHHDLPANVDHRIYTRPTRREVAVVIIDKKYEANIKPTRDILLRYVYTF